MDRNSFNNIVTTLMNGTREGECLQSEIFESSIEGTLTDDHRDELIDHWARQWRDRMNKYIDNADNYAMSLSRTFGFPIEESIDAVKALMEL